MKRIYFVRHGQTEGNAGNYFQDDSTLLTELGHEQAEIIARRISHLKPKALVSSPMIRAQQTAQHISKHTDLPIDTFESFHECLQPVHIRGKSKIKGEGLDYQQNYKKYYVKDKVFAEGFENFNIVMSRAKSCSDFLKKCKADTIVVVSHTAFIRSLAAFLLLQENTNIDFTLPLSYSLQEMTNAGISEFVYSDNNWELVMWNDRAHFAE